MTDETEAYYQAELRDAIRRGDKDAIANATHALRELRDLPTALRKAKLTARILGGPHHGQHLAFDAERAPTDWRAPHPSDLAALLRDDNGMAGPAIHHYHLTEFGVAWPDGHKSLYGLYIYQGPWAVSRIAAFLYQQHLEGSRISGGIFPAGHVADEIRRHEEYATGLAKPGPRSYETPDLSEHWLRTQAAAYADKAGYEVVRALLADSSER